MMAGASQLGRRQRLRGRSSGSIMYGHAHNAAPHAGGCHETRSAQQADVEGFGAAAPLAAACASSASLTRALVQSPAGAMIMAWVRPAHLTIRV